METIELIIGDSSDIYEFSSKEVPNLDEKWEGSWAIKEKIELEEEVLSGNLIKNDTIYNDDSLIGEDVKLSWKIFEGTSNHVVSINREEMQGEDYIVSGVITKEGVPQENTYITITIKGKIVDYRRSTMVKTNDLGEFEAVLSLSNTIKRPANSFFIFQIMPLQSEMLEPKTYYISVEIRQKDENGDLVFRKEVMQNKLKMKNQGVK